MFNRKLATITLALIVTLTACTPTEPEVTLDTGLKVSSTQAQLIETIENSEKQALKTGYTETSKNGAEVTAIAYNSKAEQTVLVVNSKPQQYIDGFIPTTPSSMLNNLTQARYDVTKKDNTYTVKHEQPTEPEIILTVKNNLIAETSTKTPKTDKTDSSVKTTQIVYKLTPEAAKAFTDK